MTALFLIANTITPFSFAQNFKKARSLALAV